MCDIVCDSLIVCSLHRTKKKRKRSGMTGRFEPSACYFEPLLHFFILFQLQNTQKNKQGSRTVKNHPSKNIGDSCFRRFWSRFEEFKLEAHKGLY